MTSAGQVRLRRGRAKPIWAGHPWVLSGAVDEITGSPGPGDVVVVVDDRGHRIGRGFFSPGSQIRVRMLTLDPEEEIDDAFLESRIRRAVALRATLGLPNDETDVYRLIHSEADGLPGVVADRYGDHVVLQLTVRGMEERRSGIAAGLAAALPLRGIRVRRVPAFEEAEQLEGAEGDLLETPVPEAIEVRENGLRYLVDPVRGQKTGHFADHRENRALFGAIAGGGRVLDAFCGTGGFALAAARGGAREVVAVDSSPASIEAVARNAERNGVADRIEPMKEDVFRLLRRLEKEGARFDAVVIDPPRMATRKKELPGALRGLKELNLRALRLVTEGGILATATCTGLVSDLDFERTLRAAALDAKRELVITHRRGAGPDHPTLLAAPEGRYLKFWLGHVRKASQARQTRTKQDI